MLSKFKICLFTYGVWTNLEWRYYFFKCGYECFDGSKRQEEVINCVNNCADRLTKVQKALNNEINMFEVSYSIVLLSYSLLVLLSVISYLNFEECIKLLKVL